MLKTTSGFVSADLTSARVAINFLDYESAATVNQRCNENGITDFKREGFFLLKHLRKMPIVMERRPPSAVQRRMGKKMGTDEQQRPRGFAAIGVFFLFGATMAAYAAVTLIKPGTGLDRLWVLNKTGHAQLASLGNRAWLGSVLLSMLLYTAAIGWCRRRYWGWVLGTTIILINAAGDLVDGAMGEWLKGAVGVAIAGLLLIYMTMSEVRNYFGTKMK